MLILGLLNGHVDSVTRSAVSPQTNHGRHNIVVSAILVLPFLMRSGKIVMPPRSEPIAQATHASSSLLLDFFTKPHLL